MSGEMFCQEAIKNFSVLLEREFLRKRKNDLLVPLAADALETIGGMEKAQRRILRPLRKMMTDGETAAATGKSCLSVDVL